MDIVTAPYGFNGHNGGGDVHVIELLARSVMGQADATASYDDNIEQLRQTGTSPYGLEDAAMATLRAQWTASLFWMISTSFLDGVVIQQQANGETLSTSHYQETDTLCDSATAASMQAIEVTTAAASKVPVKVKLPFELPLRSVTVSSSRGVWAYCTTVISEVGLLIEQHQALGVPVRMRGLHASVVAAFSQQQQVFAYLSKQWLAAKTDQSKMQAAEQALQIANTVFVIGLKLTAPALHGGAYITAKKRKLKADELDLGFDQWILTDPLLIQVKKNDPQAVQELAEFWESIPEPQAMLALSHEVSRAIATRFIRRRTGRGYANVIPWPSQFIVVKPWTVDGTRYELGDLVSFYPSRTRDSKTIVTIRKTGKIKRPFDLLGQY